MKVRGVDGCHAGWFAVASDSHGDLSAELFENASSLLEANDWDVTAIDIPIGLPSAAPRPCDIRARVILGPRQSSVFPAPVRETLSAHTYGEACRISKQAIDKKLSQQTFALLPRIREVDEYPRSHRAILSRVKEIHPEVSFAFWNHRVPMNYSKRSGFGFLERITLVNAVFPGRAAQFRAAFRSSMVSDDDILDAFAALWTAIRIQSDSAHVLESEETLDEQQMLMNIWA